MSEAIYHYLPWVLIASSAALLLILLLVDAPYGKRDRAGWGPALPVRLSWLLLEVPSFLAPLWVLATADHHPGWPGAILLLLWLGHYFNRSFIYPLRLRPKAGASFKLLMLLLGAPMNGLIGVMIAMMVIEEPHLQETAWLAHPAFLAGLGLFVGGMGLNTWADARLRALRAPGESGYAIPRGGCYQLVSCPNYLGEIIQWSGFALASFALPGLAFVLYTAANLLPRALASHRWYQQQFASYPKQRRALIPYLL